MLTQQQRTLRAELAHAASVARRKPHDPAAQEAVEQKRRDFRAAKLAEHVRQVTEDLPPLTPEQINTIAALLRGGAR